MPAKVICMASAKGGSGKTLITATFGSFLAALGKKVLLIDFDASTNGLTLFYLKEVLVQAEIAIAEGRQPKGTFELSNTQPVPEAFGLANGCGFIPATYSFKNTDTLTADSYEQIVSKLLAREREGNDYIFLDAQAGSDNFAQIAISKNISDEVVIVSEYDPMSAAGVERLKGLFREDLTYVRTWVLLNKMLPEFVKSFSDFLEVAKYLSPIPWDADVVRAYARRRLALDLINGNDHTLGVMQTLKSLLSDEIISELDKYTSDKESTIREPIIQQINDVNMKLKGLDILSRSMIRLRLNVFISIISTFIAFGTMFISREWIQKLFDFDWGWYFGGPLLLVTILLGLASGGALMEIFEQPKTPEQISVDREKEVLMEKLKNLETLREADLETLIKHNRAKKVIL